jgi:hypothetical protein
MFEFESYQDMCIRSILIQLIYLNWSFNLTGQFLVLTHIKFGNYIYIYIKLPS